MKMNVFSRYTLQSLKKNRTRTIVTIIGIILSVAMFTAVTESIVSGQQYMINSVKATIGSFHAQYSDLSSGQIKKLSMDENYDKVETLQNIGYAEIGSKNEYKPYLHVCGMSENFTDMAAVNLMEGRLPEKGNEIVLPRHLYTNGRVDYKIGDTVTVEVGERQLEADGKTVTPKGSYQPEIEQLVNTKTRTYTVVGICERPDEKIEDITEAGYTAYTLEEDSDSHSYTAFFTLKDPKLILTAKRPDEYGYMQNENTDLLAFSGVNTGQSLLLVVYSLGAILMAIIMFGSIALIYNSFSISVSERTKQFGLLRSIGATKKQMTRTVLTEALFLCGIAVPIGLLSGCLGIAVTFRLLENQFTMITGDIISTNGAVTIKLVPNVYALTIAAVISIFTALISAYIPVRRAMKMSAIEAVRMSNDIKQNSGRKKGRKQSSSLFGFEGMLARKNFRRNRKKYRTTVVSLAMSLILFISASSLCFYFQKSFDMDMNAVGYDISVISDSYALSDRESRAALEEICKTDGIDDSALVAEWDTSYAMKTKDVPEVFTRGCQEKSDNEYSDCRVSRYFVNDEAFRKLCKDNGLNEKDYFNKDEPLALLYDSQNLEFYDEETNKAIHNQASLFNANKFPATLDIYLLEENKNGGVCNGLDENGRVIYFNGEKEIRLNVEDCIKESGVKVGAKLQETPFFLMNSSTVIMYPESMIEAVCGKTPQNICYHGYFKAADYNTAYERMLKTADFYSNHIGVENESEDNELMKALMTLIKVFSYGFITLISLIAAANVFNTISTNIMLRRRELAMLKSVGMSDRGFRKMMSYESLLYGMKSIFIGLPVSLAITYLIYYVVSDNGYDMSFTLPFGNIVFALVSIFIVVFASMIYSVQKLKKYNTADELKNENL